MPIWPISLTNNKPAVVTNKPNVIKVTMAEELNENTTQNKQSSWDLKNFWFSLGFSDLIGENHQKRKSSISNCRWQLEIEPVQDKTTNDPLPIYKIYPVLQSVQILGAWCNSKIRPSTWRDVNKRIPTIPDIYAPWRPKTTCGDTINKSVADQHPPQTLLYFLSFAFYTENI